MPKVRFFEGENLIKECDAEEGQTVLEVGLKNGVSLWYGCCNDLCNKCSYNIRSGIENLLHKKREEGREFKYFPRVRTCQAEIRGDIDVQLS